jgi:hypothetical protein
MILGGWLEVNKEVQRQVKELGDRLGQLIDRLEPFVDEEEDTSR